MLNILSTFMYQDGVPFPNTKAVNASGAFATDGTEYIAEMVNDYMFGIMQSLLDYTGQTPNGILESPANSQFLNGLRRGFSYPGEIFAAAWNQDPAILGIRAIKLIGQGILRSNYTLLDQAVYCGDTNNATAPAFYHSNDAAGTIRNIAGIYLKLPDARGRVIRSLDTAGIVDPDGLTRKLGSLQGFAIQNIVGSFEVRNPSTSGTIFTTLGVFSTTAGTLLIAPFSLLGGTALTAKINFNASSSVITSTETRMTNIAFDMFIRY